MPGDIILGYDDFPSAQAALDVAIEQARQFDERLVVLFAYAPPGRSAGDEFGEHRRSDRYPSVALATLLPVV